MTRNFGFRLGILTLVLDMLKAIIPCLIAYFLGLYVTPDIPVKILIFTTGLSVILGHMYPVFYKFQGGKGIACAMGVFAVAYPISLLIFLVFGLIVLLISRIGSLASLTVVTGATIIGIIYFTSFVEIILISIIYILLLIAHIENIIRLFKGTENKLVFKRKKQENKDDSSENV